MSVPQETRSLADQLTVSAFQRMLRERVDAKNVGYFILAFGMEEVRSLATEIFKDLKEYILTLIRRVIAGEFSLTSLLSYLRSLLTWKKHVEEISTAEDVKRENFVKIELEGDVSPLIVALINQGNAQYSNEIKLSQKHIHTIHETKMYKPFSVNFPDMKISIPCDIEILYGDGVPKMKSTEISSSQEFTGIDFWSFFPKEFHILQDMNLNSGNCIAYVNDFRRANDIKSLDTHELFSLMIIDSICVYRGNSAFFYLFPNQNIPCISHKLLFTLQKDYFQIFPDKNDFTEILKLCDPKTPLTPVGAGKLILYVSSPNLSREELLSRYHALSTKIQLEEYEKASSDKKLSIYEMKFEKSKTCRKNPNPAFEKYMEKKRHLEKIKSPILDEFLAEIPPQEHIEEYPLELASIPIGKFHKGLSTLYLREGDILSLRSVLKNFTEPKSILKELEIPHKLCMLFHGLPGTGKSTAIKAVATFLSKDIFFVNLAGVQTNNQLRELFNNVQLNKGGVIVLEDIDASAPFVLARNGEIQSSTDTDAVNLSYFLNLLDGTLLTDGSIVVMTTNHKEALDPAIYRAGRVDVDIEFKQCDEFQYRRIFKSVMQRELSDSVAERLMRDAFTPADVLFSLIRNIDNTLLRDEELMSRFMIPSAV